MINQYSDSLGSGAIAPEPSVPVQALGIFKRFGATQALENVSVDLRYGEVHAFAGENGAGKSTLGKIISGLYSADAGSLIINGQQVQKWDTAKAQKSGVVLIAQELSLVPKLTVAENVFLGVEDDHLGVLKSNLLVRYEELDQVTKFGLNPNAQLDTLRIADRQKVEILRALARKARVIIMDEPTSSLTFDEVEKLHTVIKQLTSHGRSIIYVSHFLEALLETADRISVLRDGKLVKTTTTLNETKKSLVESMIGRSFESAFPEKLIKPKFEVEPRLVVSNISGFNGIQNVSIDIKPGEIVGLAGLVGSGRSEIARLIFGTDEISAGEIYFNGRKIMNFSPKASIKRGIVLIPEDRRSQGLVLVRSVKENISLPYLKLVASFGIINRFKENKLVKEMVARVKVNPPRVNSSVVDFSGGNQQKVLLAKWMFGDPSVIIFDEPTRGVDIGAKANIYETIVNLAEAGSSILLISSEHEEVMALSHRVYLVREGTIIDEVNPETTSVDDVLFSLFDIKQNESDKKAEQV